MKRGTPRTILNVGVFGLQCMLNVHTTALCLPILLPQRARSEHLSAQLGCEAVFQPDPFRLWLGAPRPPHDQNPRP